MSVDDDVEFRDLLSQTLEMNGSLSKIRAQLRASVFLTLNEEEQLQKEEPLANQKVKSSLETPEGRIMFCLVREFLEFFNLDSTLSVFDAEAYVDKCYSYGGRDEIINKLNMLLEDKNNPLLFQLIKLGKSEDSEDIKSENSQLSINKIEASINAFSPAINVAGNTFTFNKTYDVNLPNISESEISPESEELKDEKSELIKMEKNRIGKNNSNYLSDKQKANEPPLLPSLYNIGKDKISSKDPDKNLSFDDKSDSSISDKSFSISSVDSSETT